MDPFRTASVDQMRSDAASYPRVFVSQPPGLEQFQEGASTQVLTQLSPSPSEAGGGGGFLPVLQLIPVRIDIRWVLPQGVGPAGVFPLMFG